MNAILRYSAQLVLYVAFGAALGYFSSYPVFQVLPPGEALVRLSFSHGAQPVAPCRERTPEELAKLAPNMRVKLVCPRERSPVKVEIDMDGTPLYRCLITPLNAKAPLADVPDTDRVDLALALVKNGLVLASCDAPRSYADAEDDARGRKQALWGRVKVPEYKRRCTK